MAKSIAIGVLKKCHAILSPKERTRFFLVLLLVMGMALLETVGMASVMPFLTVLGDPETVVTNPLLSNLRGIAQGFGVESTNDFLFLLGFGAFLIVFVSSLYRTATIYILNDFIESCRHNIASRLLEVYLRQPYEFFLERHSGEMAKAILSEVDQLIGGVFRPIYNMLAYSLVLMCIIALLVAVNPLLALVSTCVLGGLYVLVFISLKSMLSRLGNIRATANQGRYLTTVEVFGAIKEVKLLGNEGEYLSRFRLPSQQFSSTQAIHQTVGQVPTILIEALIFGAMILLTLVLMHSAGGVNGEALGQTLPLLGLYAFAAYRMKPSVQRIYQGFASLRYGKPIVDALFSDIRPNTRLAHLPSFPPDALRPRESITIQNISYTYPNATRSTLNDLNIIIPVGSIVGIVGVTGSGKTTLVDVILGLLRPTHGAISVDKVNIDDDNLRAWQQSLGYVAQEIFLTDSSVAENIALGVDSVKIDQERVEYCARIAQVHDFISGDLPLKYQTRVGERGVRLSGGQRQRIGIARALYKDPDVLLLDEATSALDTLTESAVVKAITSLEQKKTIIMIAHRISTVKECDQIVLLDRGKVSAIGTFDEVIKEK